MLSMEFSVLFTEKNCKNKPQNVLNSVPENEVFQNKSFQSITAFGKSHQVWQIQLMFPHETVVKNFFWTWLSYVSMQRWKMSNIQSDRRLKTAFIKERVSCTEPQPGLRNTEAQMFSVRSVLKTALFYFNLNRLHRTNWEQSIIQC